MDGMVYLGKWMDEWIGGIDGWMNRRMDLHMREYEWN